VGNYFNKYTRAGIIFLRHPLTTQTNDTLRFALVAWNTFNCCSNKNEKLRKVISIWVYFPTEWILTELYALCVFAGFATWQTQLYTGQKVGTNSEPRFSVLHFSFNVNLVHIKVTCTDPCAKPPF